MGFSVSPSSLQQSRPRKPIMVIHPSTSRSRSATSLEENNSDETAAGNGTGNLDLEQGMLRQRHGNRILVSKGDDDEESLLLIANKANSSKHNQSASSRQWIFLGLILFLGAAASCAFLVLGVVSALEESDSQFQQRGAELTFAIQSAAHDYELFGLWIHQACFKHFERNYDIPLEEDHAGHLGFCSRDEFRRLYDYIDSVGVPVQAVQYVPNITHDVRAEVERQSRVYYQEHYPEYEYPGITRVVPHQNPGLRVEPETVQDFYFPLHYIEPFETNEEAIDLNPFSNDARRKAITTALATWKPAFTDRLKLVQETDPNAYGLGLMHPGVKTPVEDAAAPNAFSQIIIRIPALLERAARIAVKPHQIYIYDSTEPNDDNPIFLGGAKVQAHPNPQEAEKDMEDHDYSPHIVSVPEVELRDISRPKKSRYFETRVPVVDRQWTIVVVSTNYQPDLTFIILGGCIIFAACVIIAVWFHTSLARVSKLNAIRSEAEAAKSKMAIKQAMLERELNEFIAHEVRNPLSSAMAALSFVKQDCSAAAAAAEAAGSMTSTDGNGKDAVMGITILRKSILDDIHIIDASLQFINELLRNMLDIHRAADKQMKLDLSPTDIRSDVLDPVASILFMRGAKVDIQIECEPPNLCVETDRMRLKQIVLNLAANSSKFVEQGYIRLRACVDKDNDNSVCLFVEDSGPGIPHDKRTRLFAKFQESLDLLNQGTGIGLCVCKNLSELMGADIWLDDTFESGITGCPGTRFALRLNKAPITVVEFNGISDRHLDNNISEGLFKNLDETSSSQNNDGTLNHNADADDNDHTAAANTTNFPLHRQPDHHQHPREDELPERMTVLFVDDDTVVRKMFTRALSRIAPHWTIHQASNGETALRMVESQEFDIIFMDQYMASIEKQLLGTETVRALRGRGIETSIICGLSANDTEEQFLDSGADAFMIKPFPCEKKALEREILRILRAGKKNNVSLEQNEQ